MTASKAKRHCDLNQGEEQLENTDSVAATDRSESTNGVTLDYSLLFFVNEEMSNGNRWCCQHLLWCPMFEGIREWSDAKSAEISFWILEKRDLLNDDRYDQYSMQTWIIFLRCKTFACRFVTLFSSSEMPVRWFEKHLLDMFKQCDVLFSLSER